jgi:hypothetical protein
MRRVFALLLAISMVFIFTACSGGASDEDPDDDSQAIEEMEDEDEDSLAPDRELAEGNYENVGDGSFYLSGDNGSTKDGNEVVIKPDTSSSTYAYLDYGLEDMKGSLPTHIYIDGIEMDSQEVDKSHMGAIGLGEDEAWALTEGEHKVEAVQFENDNSDSKMKFYRSEIYTVKTE